MTGRTAQEHFNIKKGIAINTLVDWYANTCKLQEAGDRNWKKIAL